MDFPACFKTLEIMQQLKSLIINAEIHNTKIDLTIKVPVGASGNQPVPVDLSSGYEIQIPKGQFWILTGVYVNQEPSIDGVLQIYKILKKNERKLIYTTPKLSEIIETNLNIQPLPEKLVFGPKDILAIDFLPSKPNEGREAIQSVTIEAVVIDISSLEFSLSDLINLAHFVSYQLSYSSSTYSRYYQYNARNNL